MARSQLSHLTMASQMEVEPQNAIDESLYSRQLYVLGKEAMQKMAQSDVLLAGLGGVGVEIAKNVALAGVKSLTVWDPKPVELGDLGSQFYLRTDDIGSTRAEASVGRLSELNRYVPVKAVSGELTDIVSDYKVVVLSEATTENALKVDQACRAAGTLFIWVQTHGLFGMLFNDFGDGFTVTDTNGEEAVSGTVAQIESSGEVYAPDSVRHGLEDGMLIQLRNVEPPALNGIYRVKVSGPLAFNIDLPQGAPEYVKGGDWNQLKEPETINFMPLATQLAHPEQFLTDFAKFERPGQLHIAFLALLGFVQKKGALPKPYDDADAQEVLLLAKNVLSQYPDAGQIDEKLISIVAKQSAGDIAPVNGVIGGMAAQEVLKAVSGKFMPVKQFLYFDALEALPESVTVDDAKPRGTRYDKLYATLGKPFCDKLAKLRVFLVGAGAIGCEVLKNWALLGVGSQGHITVTDNDSIEKSNLNRQFLFRPKDVGQPKSSTAASAVAEMNPDLEKSFTTLTDKVGPDTQDLFDEDFWNKLDLVTNALDNVEARTYIDRRCVLFRKPLIESGTLGTKGNVQVIVPDLTESYSSSHDPPEKGIPLCTLRSFPAKIDHTIAWAKAQFTEMFADAPSSVNLYLTQPNFVEQTLKQSANVKQTLDTIYEYLVEERPLTFDECIRWAVDQFTKYYRNDIKQLLYNFPPDATTSSGAPFWAPPKRLPTPLEFDLNNPYHFEYAKAAANLHAFNYGLNGDSRTETFIEVLRAYKPQEFTPSSHIHIRASDDEPEDAINVEQDELAKVAAKLPPPSSLAGFRLHPAEFEKDDDSNFHIDFINAASNLRALNYGIEPVERSRTKFIAGRIIPAIATTTALVTGLGTLEALKVVQHRKLEEYKNGFINLALPFFGFSEPLPSTKITYNGGRSIDKVWGRFYIGEDVTLQGLIDWFATNHELEISMIACESLLLYASFFPPKKLQERLSLPISKLIETVSGKAVPQNDSVVLLEVCADDNEGEDVEDLPFVQVKVR